VAPAKFPPGLGENTEEVLQQLLGMESERVAELRKSGVVS
jgi:crotonobetainyl-CoA:carnitine CoA-transferase CaiB-like acyl-CoA transferase